MKTLIKTILFLAVAFTLVAPLKSNAQESLYKRLGGYDAIAAVTDDFITKLATNKDLEKFFIGSSDDSKKKIRQHLVDFLCEKSGGPCFYFGRPMKDSHRGLKITDKDWDIAAGLLVETLKKFNVPEKETGELLAIVSATKHDIVEN